MELFKISMTKKDYVIETIKAAQRKMGQELSYRPDEIIEQMITLAKIDIERSYPS